MKLYLDCMPCLLSQACNLAQKYLEDEDKQHLIVKRVLEEMSKSGPDSCAPLVAQKIHRIVREITGNSDPYRDIKSFFNHKMLGLENKFRNVIYNAEQPMVAALKLAAAGNIIDFGARSNLDYDEVFKIFNETMEKEFSTEVFNQLKDDISQAGTLLYLGDNAGEIVCDKLFIEVIKHAYPELKIYFATRGGPVINDITEQDAVDVGIGEYATVINNGTDIPGTVLAACSDEFLRIFDQAQVIISKGQGNFESLVDEPRKKIYFIFLCKCHLFEKKLTLKKHDLVFQYC